MPKEDAVVKLRLNAPLSPSRPQDDMTKVAPRATRTKKRSSAHLQNDGRLQLSQSILGHWRRRAGARRTSKRPSKLYSRSRSRPAIPVALTAVRPGDYSSVSRPKYLLQAVFQPQPAMPTSEFDQYLRSRGSTIVTLVYVVPLSVSAVLNRFRILGQPIKTVSFRGSSVDTMFVTNTKHALVT